MTTNYQLLRVPRHKMMRVRDFDMHVTRWGPDPTEATPPLVLLHGWQDTGDTFQFMVDAFQKDWPLIALDWRGFGRSEWAQEGYWFPDYLADLDSFLDQVSPAVPARLLGHSMGGNVASLYAGLRPDRVACVVNLEGFGLPRTSPERAPVRLRKWLDEIRTIPPLKDYDSFEQLAGIIRFRYPRFTQLQADFVATAWAKLDPDGRVRLYGDSRHRWVNPVHYHREDAEACWADIRSPMLLLIGEESEYWPKLGQDGTFEALKKVFPGVEIAVVQGAGHMLHIEKTDLVAPLVEKFLSAL